MSEIDTGGPAFPGGAASIGDGDSLPYQPGMTLRDAAALAVLPNAYSACIGLKPEDGETWALMVAREALVIADAFIAARKDGEE